METKKIYIGSFYQFRCKYSDFINVRRDKNCEDDKAAKMYSIYFEVNQFYPNNSSKSKSQQCIKNAYKFESTSPCIKWAGRPVVFVDSFWLFIQ